MDYSYARLSRGDLGFVRLRGPGLGNLLFPWARAVVVARKCSLVQIAPTWTQLNLGPLFRREADKRTYCNLFRSGGQINGLAKAYLLLTRPWIAEVEFYSGRKLGTENVVVFEGMNGLFQPILRDHRLVRAELLRITRDTHKRGLECTFWGSISVHVRLGDFVPPTPTSTGNARTPLSWYVALIKQVRNRLASFMPVWVFSDGSDEELRQILELPNTRRAGFGSSIADIFALSRANLLIASGSSFSMWASYLGRMPVIWPAGRLRQRLYYECPQAEAEYSEGQEIPEGLLELVSTR